MRSRLRVVPSDSRLIEGFALSFLNADGPLRALTQTCPKTITETIREQNSLAVDHLNGTFRAGWHALPASIAFGFVDADYLAFDQADPAVLHAWLLPLLSTLLGLIPRLPFGPNSLPPQVVCAIMHTKDGTVLDLGQAREFSVFLREAPGLPKGTPICQNGLATS